MECHFEWEEIHRHRERLKVNYRGYYTEAEVSAAAIQRDGRIRIEQAFGREMMRRVDRMFDDSLEDE